MVVFVIQIVENQEGGRVENQEEDKMEDHVENQETEKVKEQEEEKKEDLEEDQVENQVENRVENREGGQDDYTIYQIFYWKLDHSQNLINEISLYYWNCLPSLILLTFVFSFGNNFKRAKKNL